MGALTRQILSVVTIFFSVAAPLWSVWMMRRHWSKKNPAAKHRRTETMMMQPFLVGFTGIIITPLLGWLVLEELGREDFPLQEALLTLGIGLAITIFFVCYGTRQVVIYDYDHLRYRPVFGRMRTYDYSEVRSMTPIVFDLLVHVGHRWILLDFQQNWYPLWDKYHSWRKRNGLSVKKRTYKTALGRAFGEIPGGIGILAMYIVFFTGCAGICLFFTWWAWKDGALGAAALFLLVALGSIVSLVLMLVATANPGKYPCIDSWSVFRKR